VGGGVGGAFGRHGVIVGGGGGVSCGLMRGGFGWGLVRFEGFLGDEMMVRRGLNHIFRTTTLFPIRPKPTLSPFQPFFPVYPFPWHDATIHPHPSSAGKVSSADYPSYIA